MPFAWLAPLWKESGRTGAPRARHVKGSLCTVNLQVLLGPNDLFVGIFFLGTAISGPPLTIFYPPLTVSVSGELPTGSFGRTTQNPCFLMFLDVVILGRTPPP